MAGEGITQTGLIVQMVKDMNETDEKIEISTRIMNLTVEMDITVTVPCGDLSKFGEILEPHLRKEGYQLDGMTDIHYRGAFKHPKKIEARCVEIITTVLSHYNQITAELYPSPLKTEEKGETARA